MSDAKVEHVSLDKMESLIAEVYARRHGFDGVEDVRPSELLYLIVHDAKAVAAALREGGYVT